MSTGKPLTNSVRTCTQEKCSDHLMKIWPVPHLWETKRAENSQTLGPSSHHCSWTTDGFRELQQTGNHFVSEWITVRQTALSWTPGMSHWATVLKSPFQPTLQQVQTSASLPTMISFEIECKKHLVKENPWTKRICVQLQVVRSLGDSCINRNVYM